MSAQKSSASTSKGLNTSKDAGKFAGVATIVRTAAVRLEVSAEDSVKLEETQSLYGKASRLLAEIMREQPRGMRPWQRHNLHHAGYRRVRSEIPELGSQLVCNTVRSVSAAAKSWISNNPKFLKDDKIELPAFKFANPIVHLDKNTISYSADRKTASIYTTCGRIKATLAPGAFQEEILSSGAWKESNLVFRKGKRGKPGHWELHIAVEQPSRKVSLEGLTKDQVEGTDVGENNMAATTHGLWKGGKLKYDRDCYLALRKRLQCNGSRSANQHLRKASGRERRHVKHVNNVVSKQIVQEAKANGIRVIVLEELTHIRDRIKAGLRVRTRLHRWPFRELQEMIVHKAAREGIEVVFVDPRYTSQTCSKCKALGKRRKHRFVCSNCGNRAHADVNSACNLRDLGYQWITQGEK